jgi:dihydroorotate dehydrogenase (fumarate)
MDAIRKIEDKGAGALIIKSLFEEQIQYQSQSHDEDLHMYDNWHAEMQSIFPEVEHAGPDEHLMWTQRAKEAVKIPVIASLNAINTKTWADWAVKLEETGVDGLELNFFAIPNDRLDPAASIEDDQIEAIKAVKKAVKIPVSIKLSPYYTSPVQFITRLADAGADGLVLFNRFFHPAIDIEKESSRYPWNLSSPEDNRLPLRFVGMLADKVSADICASNGIHSADDALSMILAGAGSFQVVSAVYKNKLDHIGTILKGMEEWMDKKGYGSIADFRGKLSEAKNEDKMAYRRAQYVRMLLRSNDYVKRPNLI